MNSFCLLWYCTVFKNTHKLFELLDDIKTSTNDTTKKIIHFLIQKKESQLSVIELVIHHEIYGALLFYNYDKYILFKKKIYNNDFLSSTSTVSPRSIASNSSATSA